MTLTESTLPAVIRSQGNGVERLEVWAQMLALSSPKSVAPSVQRFSPSGEVGAGSGVGAGAAGGSPPEPAAGRAGAFGSHAIMAVPTTNTTTN